MKSDDTPTYLDILKKFPSAKPGIEYLLDYVPAIKPRLYSIASSPTASPDKIDLFVVNDDWTTKSGKYRHGLTTGYMKDLEVGQSCSARINGAAITVAPNQEPPIILAGMGSGLAPLRAFVLERQHAAQQGEKCGPMHLFFGARHEKTEWFYYDDFKPLIDDGSLNVYTAFSRDQKHKIYIQDRLKEEGEILYKTLMKDGGYFYYCGAGGSAPAACRDAIRAAIAEGEGISEDEAEKIICDMQINGRYNVEAW